MKERLLNLKKGFLDRDHLALRIPLVFVALALMAFSLSWLELVQYGTDPFTTFNFGLAAKLDLSIGDTEAIFNTILFIIVIIAGAEDFGWGTLGNMILIGYMLQFFSGLWDKLLPENYFADHFAMSIVVMLAALILFVFAAATYMDGGLGVSPYDALPFIIQRKLKRFPVRVVRIVYDLAVFGISILLGRPVFIATFLMCFLLGPIIEWVGKLLKKIFPFD
jgi:uncharacterized membrane protein YczE